MTSRALKWTLAEDREAAHSLEASSVLIVEDDPDACVNLTDILELDGRRVETVQSLRAAFQRPDLASWDVILLDRRLPDGDACDALPKFRERAPHANLIIITGNSDLSGAVAALRHGANDYILKPIQPDTLRATLVRLQEKARMEQALRASQAELRGERDFIEKLLETVPSFVLLLDAQGRIVRFNSALTELSGYKIEEVQGRDCLETFFAAGDRTRLRSIFRRLLWSGSVSGRDSTVRRQDGREVEVRWSARLLRDASGGLLGVIVSGQDGSELKQALERALQAGRLAAIGEAMAGLIHESRNALQRGLACAEMLAEEIRDRPAALDLLARLQLAQRDLHQLFEEVREYAAPIHLQRSPSRLADIWRQAWQELEDGHRAKNLRLVELAPCDCACKVDPFALRQVFRNLFENAIQASPAGAEISVRCEPATFAGQPEWRISIRDQGPGIPAPVRRQVLEPFFTTKAKGTGLGLAICQRIVHAHRGRLEVCAGSSAGAEIVIHLPRGKS